LESRGQSGSILLFSNVFKILLDKKAKQAEDIVEHVQI